MLPEFTAGVLVFLVALKLWQTQENVVHMYFLKKGREEDVVSCNILRHINWMPIPPPMTQSLWMKVRCKDWWERVVLKEFTDFEWKLNFRMTRQSFMILCEVMSDYMAPAEHTVRAPIPVIMRVAVALYKLGSCAEYRVISNQFGIHKSTVKKCVYLFCKGMVQSPIKQLIKVPNEEEALELARRFEEISHIPQIMGLIDGTHIPVLPPTDGYKDFVNRKGWPSYVLQGVVDDKGCFWNISCKMPGSAHDATVLRQSELFQKAHLLAKGMKNIEGEEVRLLVVGDPAYPLLDWLIKGYTNSPNLTPEQESFNVYLSSLRVGVEMAFGKLKSRWRVLLKRSDFHFSFAPTMIATCCALHNFCEKQKDAVSTNWLEEFSESNEIFHQPVQPVNVSTSNSGINAREVLTKYLASQFPLRQGHLH